MRELRLTPEQLATAFTEALVGDAGATIALKSREFRLHDSSRVSALTMQQGDSSITIAEDGSLLASDGQTHRLAGAVEAAGWPAVAEAIRAGVPLEAVVGQVRNALNEEDAAALLHVLAATRRCRCTSHRVIANALTS